MVEEKSGTKNVAENQDYFLSKFSSQKENLRNDKEDNQLTFYKPEKSRYVVRPVVGEHHEEETD